jgi:hypothetical protein
MSLVPENIHKTKQNKTKQNKTKQNKTKQNKTKQNKTKQKHDSENTIYVTQHQDVLCCQNTKLNWILLALHVKKIILVF